LGDEVDVMGRVDLGDAHRTDGRDILNHGQVVGEVLAADAVDANFKVGQCIV
jgi:hypothetical protein